MKKFLSFIAIIVPVLCSGNVGATTCPAGCFCLNNGEFNLSTNYQNFCTVPASKINIISSGISVCHSWISNRDFHGPTATYYFEDFSELYKGYFGAYGFINGNFVYINDCWDNADNPNGIFQCPTTHPNSDKGAKTIFECYRITANGQKEYYTHTNTQNNYSGNYDNSNINALMQNLQSALNQANTAAQNLQTALNSYNLTNTTQSQTATTLNNTNTITKMTNAQTFVSPTTAPTTTTQPQTTQSTTATPTTTAPFTMKLSDVKTDSTTSSPLKKFDFGDLSSVFTSAKVAKPVPTRSATERQKSTSARTTATPTTTRVHDNAAAARPTQTKERASATRHQ